MTAPGKRQKVKGNANRDSLVFKDDKSAAQQRRDRDDLLKRMRAKVSKPAPESGEAGG